MASSGMKALQEWCKRNTADYPNVEVRNMTTSWKDGLAFCALIHRFRPDLIDFKSLSKENPLYNHQLAFSVAEKELGIAALLDADDMVNMKSPDKLSVMTYLSQYYNVLNRLKPVSAAQGVQPSSKPAVRNVSSQELLKPRTTNVMKKANPEENICACCGKHVHLVQRFFYQSKLYHRVCYRNNSLKIMRERKQSSTETTVKLSNSEVDAKDKVPANDKKAAAASFVGDILSSRIAKIQPAQHNEISKTENGSESLVDSVAPVSSKVTPDVEPAKPPQSPNKNMPTAMTITEPPKPRSRTKSSFPAVTDDQSKTQEDVEMNPAPVAAPRRNIFSEPTEATEKDNEDTLEYDDLLNPFGDGDSNDTSLSFSSSSDEEDDNNNPFEDDSDLKKELPEDPKLNPFESDVKEEPNPFGKADEEVPPPREESKVEKVAKDLEKTENEGNPFGDYEEEEEENKNPFGDVEDQEDDQLNPFLAGGEDGTKKVNGTIESNARGVTPRKKRPAPVPPARKKKAPPPPRPPAWKESATDKMNELNAKNEYDSRFGSLQIKKSPKPPKPPMPKTIQNSPQNSVKTKPPAPKLSPLTKHPKSQREAPGHGYPLIKRKVQKKMSEEEISNELKVLDLKLSDLEVKGVKLEEMLRFAMEPGNAWNNEEDHLLQEWFDLVHKKNHLVRRETDLVFLMQEQRLEAEHADIEFQLRTLLNKPDTNKADEDKQKEEELLQKLLEVVERRNIIINSIEEARLKEEQEDVAYEQMTKLQHVQNKKKKKLKVKKIFSKHKSDKATAASKPKDKS